MNNSLKVLSLLLIGMVFSFSNSAFADSGSAENAWNGDPEMSAPVIPASRIDVSFQAQVPNIASQDLTNQTEATVVRPPFQCDGNCKPPDTSYLTDSTIYDSSKVGPDGNPSGASK